MSTVIVHEEHEKQNTLNRTFAQAEDLGLYDYSNLEYGDDYYNIPLNETSPTGNHLSGIDWVLANVMMVVIYPLTLLSCALLLYALVRDRSFRKDPSKWLIAHATACLFILTLLYYIKYFTPIYLLPSLETTPLCPTVHIVIAIISMMMPVSFTLVLIERFRVVIQGNAEGTGMGKWTVIISLTSFWLINIIIRVVSFLVRDTPLFIYNSSLTGKKVCYLNDSEIANYATFATIILNVLSVLVVTIGSLVVGCRRDDVALKRFVVAPIVFIGLVLVLLFYSIYFVHFFLFTVYLYWPGLTVIFLLNMMGQIACLSFPLTWLITWSLNGQITWQLREDCSVCFKKRDNQEFQLQEGAKYTRFEDVP